LTKGISEPTAPDKNWFSSTLYLGFVGWE
jgi:hypothetical protein